uniref:Uncharacterized protein n=1 Tax=Ditylum brightwellii TaxID=49249 RepID=A0A7S4RWV5_9STRA
MTIPKTKGESSPSEESMPEIVRNDTWEDEGGEDSDNEEKENVHNVKKHKGKKDRKKPQPVSPKITNKPKRISALDSFLQASVTFASNSYLTDRGIKLLTYTLWLLSRLTERYQKNPELSPGLRKMYGDLSMVRYALRLYGLPVSIEDIRTGGSWKGWDDARIHFLGKIMAWSMAFYYPLEHIAYGGFVVPKLIRVDTEKYTAYSCRAWLIFVLSDLVSTFFKLKELRKRRDVLLKSRELGDGDTARPTEEEIQKKEHDINKQIKLSRIHVARCVFFVPQVVHWSYSKWARDPLFSENVVNGCALTEAIICFYQALCSLRN